MADVNDVTPTTVLAPVAASRVATIIAECTLMKAVSPALYDFGSSSRSPGSGVFTVVRYSKATNNYFTTEPAPVATTLSSAKYAVTLLPYASVEGEPRRTIHLHCTVKRTRGDAIDPSRAFFAVRT